MTDPTPPTRPSEPATGERLCAWLTANGLDPAQIPEDTEITVRDGQITVRERIEAEGSFGRGWLLGPDGELVTRERTVPLRREE